VTSIPSRARRRSAAVLVSLLVLLLVVIPVGPPASAVDAGTVAAPADAQSVARPGAHVGERLRVAPTPASALLRSPAGLSLLLVEASDGQHLVAVAEERRRPVASTIKLLTALTVVELLGPGTLITVGREVLGVEGALFGLRPGEVWSVEDLLVALLLRSGNEVAVTLAVAASGSEDAFVRAMERTLERLGVVGVTLGSASGLSEQDAVSAVELAVVARASLAEPRIAGLVGLPTTIVAQGAVDVVNRNLLVGRYGGATGLKTGFTSAAGHTLAASARRDGRELVAIVLGATSEEERLRFAAALLDHGFERTARREVRGTLELRSGSGPVLLSVGGRWLTVETGAELAIDWPVTLRPDDEVAQVGVRLAGQYIGAVDVVRVDARTPTPSGSSLGPAFADAVYTGLRAAGLAGRLG
jgi:D-alanyl-D-alanine carboxypeptidase (penicillin-binding protein 5/6)